MQSEKLYQKLKREKKENDEIVALLSKVNDEMEKKLEEATKPILDKYRPILTNLEIRGYRIFTRLIETADTIEECGTFDASMIKYFFVAFLSYVEGETFVPFCYRYENDRCFYEGVIKESANNNIGNLSYSNLDEMYKNGDLIVLDVGNGYSKTLSLYDGNGNPNFQFGKYNYLKEFVNRLVQYRADNDLRDVDSMSLDDLNTFASDFLSTHPDLVAKNKDKRVQMIREQMLQKPFHRKLSKKI